MDPARRSGVATRLLLVDDDLPARSLVTSRLEEHGISVSVAGAPAAAVTALHHTSFDVAILDLDPLDGSGLDLLQALREPGSTTHVIIVSEAAGETDRVNAFELGADDYLVKPISVPELTARVLAVRRRRERARDTNLRYGDVAIDLAARKVTVADALLHLTALEYDLLAFLATRPCRAFSRDDLLRAVWQSAADWQHVSTVTEHVRRLRSKIEQDPSRPRLLQTVRGVGYRFDPPAPDRFAA